ncbi:MAG: polysaccharide pyruvyl transferase family protein [Gemmatimonadales bacterium]
MTPGGRAAVTAIAEGREAEIRRLQGMAVDALRGAGGDAPFALVDFPDHANVGDSAIWAGTTAYFRDHRAREPRYVASVDGFSEPALRAAMPAGPIFVHGGGNFGDLWPRHQEFRERLLARFPDREIIQLPQSIHFDEPSRIERTARAIARHGRFRLFVRDHWSAEFAAAHFDCPVALCPDMAMFLGALDRSRARVDVFYLLRTDKERAMERAMERAVERALVGNTGRPDYSFRVGDWLGEHRLPMAAGQLLRAARDQRHGRTRAGLRVRRYETDARTRVRRGCRLLSSGRVVITDRLHAHILGLLLGIPHAVLDNTYGKLGRFLDAWLRDAPGVFRASSLAEAEQWAAVRASVGGWSGSCR